MKLIILDDQLTQQNDSLKIRLMSDFPEIDILTEGFIESNSEQSQYINSLLLFRFTSPEISQHSEKIIKKYLAITSGKGPIFPVSYDSKVVKPPEIVKHLKAYPIDNQEIVLNRILSFFGLMVLGKDHMIFVSYRAIDGKKHAMEIEGKLKQSGFSVWLDEAKDSDGEGNIKLGEDAQEVIETNLKRCSAIVLVDSPLVAESPWVKIEIDTANAELIPILPACFHSENKSGPRFRVLRDLNRWVDISIENPSYDKIVNALFEYLKDIYQRKRRLPGEIEKSFRQRGFDWNILDNKKLYYKSTKTIKIEKNILSHASLVSGLYPPFLTIFSQAYSGTEYNFNYRFLIYDGDPMNESEIKDLQLKDKSVNVKVIHHQNLDIILDDL